MRVSDDSQRIFVYGTLKQGTPTHQVYLSDARFIGRCSIRGLLLHLGPYPGWVDHKTCRVYGEVYEVPWSKIEALDAYEAVPDLYNRKQVETTLGRAWVYVKQNPPDLTPATLCVDRGDWDKPYLGAVPYSTVLEYFLNKTGHVNEVNASQPTASSQPETRPPAPLLQPDPVVIVGPGLETI